MWDRSLQRWKQSTRRRITFLSTGQWLVAWKGSERGQCLIRSCKPKYSQINLWVNILKPLEAVTTNWNHQKGSVEDGASSGHQQASYQSSEDALHSSFRNSIKITRELQKIWNRVVIELQDDCRTKEQTLFLQNCIKFVSIFWLCLSSHVIFRFLIFVVFLSFVIFVSVWQGTVWFESARQE